MFCTPLMDRRLDARDRHLDHGSGLALSHLDKGEAGVLHALAGQADEEAQVVQAVALGHEDEVDAAVGKVSVGHDACKEGV